MSEPLVSVVFVTYERPDLLRRTLLTFRSNTAYPNLELIVADDGSGPATQAAIRAMPFDLFKLASRNRGLGANLNAGLEAARGDFVLVLQDDWDCHGPPDYLRRAVELLRSRPDIGIVRFYGAPLPQEESGGGLAPGGMVRSDAEGPLGYSDTPHLRSRACLERLGSYREDLWMEDCELEYVARFSGQGEFGVAALRDSYNKVFVHTGEERSHRTGSRRHRIFSALARLAEPLKRRAPRLHAAGRQAVRGALAWTARIRAGR